MKAIQKIERRILDKLTSVELFSPVVAMLGTLAIAKRHRRRCRIKKEGQYWFHYYSDATLVDFKIHSATPEFLDAQTREYYLQSYLPGRGDTVVDVGAGVGTELLTFSRLVGPGGRVIAVEAHPKTFACLEVFCAANSLANVELINRALGEEKGTAYLQDLDVHVSNAVTTDSSNSVATPMTTLQALLEELKIDEVDFLKMNIEGAELPVLKVAKQALPSIRNATIACHDFKAEATGNDFFRTKEEVATLLRNSGFEITRRDGHALPWVADHLDAIRK